jgi:hypothetical protein
LLLKSRCDIEENALKDSSSLLNWLYSRKTFSNDGSVKRDEGIAPLKSLPERSRWVRYVKFEIEFESVP